MKLYRIVHAGCVPLVAYPGKAPFVREPRLSTRTAAAIAIKIAKVIAVSRGRGEASTYGTMWYLWRPKTLGHFQILPMPVKTETKSIHMQFCSSQGIRAVYSRLCGMALLRVRLRVLRVVRDRCPVLKKRFCGRFGCSLCYISGL